MPQKFATTISKDVSSPLLIIWQSRLC